MKKIVIIGAGSAMFTQGLVVDLIRHSAHHPWHLALCDTNPAILDSIAKLCAKMVRSKKRGYYDLPVDRPARPAARGGLRGHRHRSGRPQSLGKGCIHPQKIRHFSAGGRYGYARRDLAGHADDPGYAGHRPRRGKAVPGSALLQLFQSDDRHLQGGPEKRRCFRCGTVPRRKQYRGAAREAVRARPGNPDVEGGGDQPPNLPVRYPKPGRGHLPTALRKDERDPVPGNGLRESGRDVPGKKDKRVPMSVIPSHGKYSTPTTHIRRPGTGISSNS